MIECFWSYVVRMARNQPPHRHVDTDTRRFNKVSKETNAENQWVVFGQSLYEASPGSTGLDK